jgi:hypothetical protein
VAQASQRSPPSKTRFPLYLLILFSPSNIYPFGLRL